MLEWRKADIGSCILTHNRHTAMVYMSMVIPDQWNWYVYEDASNFVIGCGNAKSMELACEVAKKILEGGQSGR